MGKKDKKSKDSKKDKADFQDKIRELGETIDKIEDEKLEIENKLKRALADYSNLERDMEKRVDLAMTNMISRVAKRVIEVLDDADLALKAMESLELDDQSESWANGIVELVQKLRNSLKDMDVEVIEVSVGDDFDSSRHEALAAVHVKNEDEKGKIVEVLQNGYAVGDTVIRCARVAVGK
ncbi:nucleotide exchange factor GrpE [Candidatus Dojkabacteria bacterium]|nr:nucleotide exchange factor GrpE [Candidatus Dojkabacteria bacterium]